MEGLYISVCDLQFLNASHTLQIRLFGDGVHNVRAVVVELGAGSRGDHGDALDHVDVLGGTRWYGRALLNRE